MPPSCTVPPPAGTPSTTRLPGTRSTPGSAWLTWLADSSGNRPGSKHTRPAERLAPDRAIQVANEELIDLRRDLGAGDDRIVAPRDRSPSAGGRRPHRPRHRPAIGAEPAHDPRAPAHDLPKAGCQLTYRGGRRRWIGDASCRSRNPTRPRLGNSADALLRNMSGDCCKRFRLSAIVAPPDR